MTELSGFSSAHYAFFATIPDDASKKFAALRPFAIHVNDDKGLSVAAEQFCLITFVVRHEVYRGLIVVTNVPETALIFGFTVRLYLEPSGRPSSLCLCECFRSRRSLLC